MKSRYVGDAPFFSALSEQEQESVSNKMHLEQRRAGDVLFQPGDDSTALYLIKSGWVRLLAEGGAVLASQGPGSLVGETELFLEKPRTLGAAVATEAELWVLTKQDLTDLIAETPQIGLKLALAFGSRLSLFDRYLREYRLKPLPFLAGLDEDALAAIARRLVPVEKQEGEFIIEEGQPPEAMFIVETGQVRLPSSEEGGDYSELGPGDTFGEMALLTARAHSRSAQAATAVVLWALSAAEFETLAEERPEIRLALSKSFREPLTPQDMAPAMERLSAVSLFSGSSEEVLWAVAQRLLLCHVPAGELVFAEGAPGDAFYLIDSGQVEVSPSGETLENGACFGELALLTGKPRSIAARATENTNLWVLYRSDFDDLINRYPALSVALSKELGERLAEMDRRFSESHLRSLKLLSGLPAKQLDDIGDRLEPVRFRQGEVILQEGAPGDEMYFIESGRVQVVRGQGSQARVLAELGAGDLFGEMALLTGSTRSATVTALSDLNLWLMSRTDFDYMVSTYPSLALALSRLLSERLRTADDYLLQRPSVPVAATAAVAAGAAAAVATPPVHVAVPVPVPEPVAKPTQPAKPRPRPRRTQPSRSPVAGIGKSFNGAVDWFGGLSSGAKVRLVLVTVLFAWLLLIVAPALIISSLASDNVTNLQGAIAFVQTATPLPSDTPLPSETPILPTATPVSPTPTMVPPTETPALLPETPTPVPPTETPILPTDTPLPPTETPTPVPPTPTPVPPTRMPAPPKPAESEQAAAAAAAVPRNEPARDLDPRLPALNVGIQPANVQPGQSYWRLVKAYWQNKEESGNDHTIYIEVLDENGSRITGQPVEIQWQDGNLVVTTEDKPPYDYPANFPMYGTLGSYQVRIGGLPSDTITGLGMGTIEQPAFTIHTNFLLTFQRMKR